MKGGYLDWLGHQIPRNQLKKQSNDESGLEGSDMRSAKRRQEETNKLAKVVIIRDIYNNYISEGKTIDEFKESFRPEGDLGSIASTLFYILNDNKDDIKKGSWGKCIKLIDELYKYKESFKIIKDEGISPQDEDDSPPSSPTSEPNSRGQLRKKKKRTKNKKHKMSLSSRSSSSSAPKSMSKMERRAGKVTPKSKHKNKHKKNKGKQTKRKH